MPESKVISLDERAKDEEKPFLEQLLQEGARKLLQAAIENEVIDYLQFHKDRRDEDGHIEASRLRWNLDATLVRRHLTYHDHNGFQQRPNRSSC